MPQTRSFIRHPSNMPIEVSAGGDGSSGQALRDVSHGGLCFRYSKAVPVGAMMRVRVPVIQPEFEAECRVVWCLADGDGYQVGVEFLAKEDLYRVRMIEQLCQIEDYRQDIETHEGRHLTSQEAAMEWISKFASRFPDFGT